MPKYGWLLDAKRCIECRACESACKQWNNVNTGVNVRYRRVQVREKGKFPQVSTTALSLACNHCDNAYCVKICPPKALTLRSDGIVVQDASKCIGCMMCANFCPYGAPNFNPNTNKMEKCTMCVDRVDAGLQPACATLCPTGALTWGPWAEVGGQGSAAVEGFFDPSYTRPSIRFITDPWPPR
jgi:Fe-S-cluster-containing dehydrogenase component